MNNYIISPLDLLGILFVLNILSLICFFSIKCGIDHERNLRIGSTWINNYQELDNPWKSIPYFKVVEIKKNKKGKSWIKGLTNNYITVYMSKSQLLKHYKIYNNEQE